MKSEWLIASEEAQPRIHIGKKEASKCCKYVCRIVEGTQINNKHFGKQNVDKLNVCTFWDPEIIVLGISQKISSNSWKKNK